MSRTFERRRNRRMLCELCNSYSIVLRCSRCGVGSCGMCGVQCGMCSHEFCENCVLAGANFNDDVCPNCGAPLGQIDEW